MCKVNGMNGLGETTLEELGKEAVTDRGGVGNIRLDSSLIQ